jgi:transposase
MMPGVNVSALARALGLSPQQVFAWRRKAVRAAQARTREPGFAMVAVETDGGDEKSGVVEIAIGAVRVRVGPAVPAGRVAEIVRAIRAA